jgi:hypothetical protein
MESSSTSCIGSADHVRFAELICIQVDLHLRVAWKRKDPDPTKRYPMNDTRNTVSCPSVIQLRIPLADKYMNQMFVWLKSA